MKVSPLFDGFGSMIQGNGESLLSLDARAVHATFRTDGAILLRGFSGDEATFEAFTRKFSARLLMHGNIKRTTVGTDRFSHNVVSGNHLVHLHSERCYMPAFAWPNVLYFYCIQPPAEGGETTVCDGTRLLSMLPQNIKDIFDANRLLYVLPLPNPVVQGPWQRHFLHDSRLEITLEQASRLLSDSPNVEYAFMNDNKQLFMQHIMPALTKCQYSDAQSFCNHILSPAVRGYELFEDQTMIPMELIEEILDIAEPITFKLSWKPGDVIMLDNTRLMHGRRAFTDPNRRIQSRLGQGTAEGL
jgi:alpha-ketoglutarate-dependent taurine dioxygenase